MPEILAFNMSSSGGAFPLALSDPVKPRTPSPQHPYPTKDHLSSPVKPVIPHFADHKRDEVQAFGYDKDLHQLAAFGEQDFLDFLGVDEAFLNVDPPDSNPAERSPVERRRRVAERKLVERRITERKRVERPTQRAAQRAVERAVERAARMPANLVLQTLFRRLTPWPNP
jgi:hypothetical protein